MRDGKADWTPAALAAAANVYLDDYLLFDVAKPITDTSFFEIEKSTINGRDYQTGGGRTVDANVIDIHDHLDGEQRSGVSARRRQEARRSRAPRNFRIWLRRTRSCKT